MPTPVTWTPTAESALDRLAGRKFATVTEVAAVFGYDPRTIRRAIEAKQIPAVKAGSTYRVPVAWLRDQPGWPGRGDGDAA